MSSGDSCCMHLCTGIPSLSRFIFLVNSIEFIHMIFLFGYLEIPKMLLFSMGSLPLYLTKVFETPVS